MVGVGAGAVADQFSQWHSPSCQRVLQGFNYQNARPLAHDETVATAVKGPRSLCRAIVITRGERTGRGEAGLCDQVDGRLGAATNHYIRLATANQARTITQRLHTGRAGRHWCANRSLESIPQGYMTGSQVDQKRRHCEGRQSARATQVGRAYRLGNGLESTNTGSNDGGCSLPSVR